MLLNYQQKKWKSVWWFNRYKKGWKGSSKPITEMLSDITKDENRIRNVCENMGWLTWTDLFKITMRGMLQELFITTSNRSTTPKSQ